MNTEALRVFIVQKLTNAANLRGPLGRLLLSDQDRAFLTGSATFIGNKMPAAVLADWAGYVPQTFSEAPMQAVQIVPAMEGVATAGSLLGGALGSILAGLFSAGNWIAVLTWISTHAAAIEKAVQDVVSGNLTLETAIADLKAIFLSGQ